MPETQKSRELSPEPLLLLVLLSIFSVVTDDPPETRVTLLPPRTQLFTGDNVTLICDVGNYSTGWRYSWYKDSTQSPALHGGDTAGTRYTVHSASLSHSGQYWCRVGREDASFHLNYSQPVSLQVTERPQAELTLVRGWTQMYASESFTLNCRVHGSYSEWSYQWHKKGEDGPVFQLSSSALDELFTKPVLWVRPGNSVIEGDSVTLHCDSQLNSKAQDMKLQYHYTEERGDWKTVTSKETLMIPIIRLNHIGQYQCEVEVPQKSIRRSSNWTKVTVGELFTKPVLWVRPGNSVIEGDSVTLHCDSQLNSKAQDMKLQLEYLWFKDRLGSPVTNTSDHSVDGNILQISSVLRSDWGQYKCLVQRGQPPQSSYPSNPFFLNISYHKVILQTPPLPLTEGDNVTLVCRDKSTSSSFYKDNKKLLSDTTQNILRISPVRKDAEGIYRCQHSQDSEEVQISVRDLFSRVTLLVSPGGSVQEGEPVNLTRDAETSGYVRPLVLYSFFRDGELLSERSGSALYSIDALNQTLTGSYSCAAETPHGFQKNSTGVTITLQVFP
ncbi:Fc receptor-like protein 2 [Amia ocellicauda]|uniref:Fc receptor-like protein 2 n=1 Tax=Amia ocellicauda TaxID=2972642 RepID=UPI0034647103